METDLRARTQALCADRPFRLVGSPRAMAPDVAGTESETSDGRDISSDRAPLEIFQRHWQRKNGAPPPDEIVSCFREILDKVRTAGKA
jgi:hypothetical protein